MWSLRGFEHRGLLDTAGSLVRVGLERGEPTDRTDERLLAEDVVEHAHAGLQTMVHSATWKRASPSVSQGSS